MPSHYDFAPTQTVEDKPSKRRSSYTGKQRAMGIFAGVVTGVGAAFGLTACDPPNGAPQNAPQHPCPSGQSWQPDAQRCMDTGGINFND